MGKACQNVSKDVKRTGDTKSCASPSAVLLAVPSRHSMLVVANNPSHKNYHRIGDGIWSPRLSVLLPTALATDKLSQCGGTRKLLGKPIPPWSYMSYRIYRYHQNPIGLA